MEIIMLIIMISRKLLQLGKDLDHAYNDAHCAQVRYFWWVGRGSKFRQTKFNREKL